MKCKDCPELIERYGYCPVAEDWVTEKINKFSLNLNNFNLKFFYFLFLNKNKFV